jgi:hypothetical protein
MVSGGGMTPEKARRRQQAFRVVNVPMRGLLSLPFATPISGARCWCTTRVARAARPYRQPVSYVEDGDTLLTPGRGN